MLFQYIQILQDNDQNLMPLYEIWMSGLSQPDKR